jgi:hypothetical protein
MASNSSRRGACSRWVPRNGNAARGGHPCSIAMMTPGPSVKKWAMFPPGCCFLNSCGGLGARTAATVLETLFLRLVTRIGGCHRHAISELIPPPPVFSEVAAWRGAVFEIRNERMPGGPDHSSNLNGWVFEIAVRDRNTISDFEGGFLTHIFCFRK